MRPLHYDAICKMLLERFGEPIGDREAAPTSTKKKDMSNRGFGSDDLDECGEMMPTEIDEKAPPKKKGKPQAPEWVRKAIKKGTAPSEPLHTALRGGARRSGKIAY